MVYYVKEIDSENNIIAIYSYGFKPDLEGMDKLIAISEDEYNTILEEINSKEQDIIKNDTPEFIRNNYELNISEDILLDIPYNKSNFIISTEDIYINGVYNKYDEEIESSSIEGYLLFKENNNEITINKSESISIRAGLYSYNFTATEEGILVSVRALSDESKTSIQIEILHSKLELEEA